MIRGSGGGKEIGTATRLRPTVALLELLARAGITIHNWREHFRPLPRPTITNNPIVVKASSTRELGQKRQGRPLQIDPSNPFASELARQVNELNEFFASIRIDPEDRHYAFQRVFNQGDLPGFAWNKGGRLISMGASYQQMPRVERQSIRLMGEAVVEIDVRASHLTILHAVLGSPFNADGTDPYAIDGIPREVVKAWVTMTIGHDRFQTRWSKPNKDRFAATYGDLQKAFPIAGVREKVLERLPILADWPSCPIRWGDLQFLESCAVVDTVHSLAMDHGIPALPVHDSIIVPVSYERVAIEVFSSRFRRNVGVEPALTVDKMKSKS
jgi:hypothetical protein